MTINTTEMIDLVFDVSGESLPESYQFALWAELLRIAPWLAELDNAGLLPLRLTSDSGGMLLPKRTKLALRIPSSAADRVADALCGQQIQVAGSKLLLGGSKKRTIQHYPTIHAPIVAGVQDEIEFIDDINRQLQELGVVGSLICGKRQTVTADQQVIEGFSLVIHDLKSDASLTLQYAGLGKFRQFGCGVFIPYKVISGLNDE